MALSTPLTLLGGLVGAVFLTLGLAELRNAQRIRGQSPDPVSETTRGGPVELAGTGLAANETVRGPFSGAECLVCEYEVLEYRSSGKSSSWQTVDEDTIGLPFHLEDNTGSVLVDPQGATLNLAKELDHKVKGGETPHERIRKFIRDTPSVDSEDYTHDLKIVEIKGGNDRRYVERRLDVGSHVHVVGKAEGAYDATHTLGTVNAVVGAPGVGSGSFFGRWRRRLSGRPFTIADGQQGEAAWRVAKPGLLLALVGVAVLAAALWASGGLA
jgi:hypothetical protein